MYQPRSTLSQMHIKRQFAVYTGINNLLAKILRTIGRREGGDRPSPASPFEVVCTEKNDADESA